MTEFKEQIEKHRHELYGYIHKNVWDSSVADDVFSEAVLVAYKNSHKFQHGSNFRAWMFKIVTNKCFVANRESARYSESIDDIEEPFSDLSSDQSYVDILKDPDEFLQRCGDEVNIAFKKLSTNERSCILLKSAENFSYKEISQILDIPAGTVMTHLARGRAKLRAELMDYGRKEGIVCKEFFPGVIADREQKRKAQG